MCAAPLSRRLRSSGSLRHRRLFLEPLEVRRVLSSDLGTDWKLPYARLDVNRDRSVTPLDALSLVNDLNQNGLRALPSSTTDPAETIDHYDTNRDGYLSPGDVLLVINALNLDHDAPVIAAEVLLDDAPAISTNLGFILGSLTGSVFSGKVSDDWTGVQSFVARVDDGPPMEVPLNIDGEFAFDPGLPTDGSADGQHHMQFVALDGRGQVGTLEKLFELNTQTTDSGASHAPDSGVASSSATAGEGEDPSPSQTAANLDAAKVSSLLKLQQNPKSSCHPAIHFHDVMPITPSCSQTAAGGFLPITFTNISQQTIYAPYFKVTRLDGPSCGNGGCQVIKTSGMYVDAGPLGSGRVLEPTGKEAQFGGVEAKIPIATGGDDLLSPGESFTHLFEIDMVLDHPPEQFYFFVDVYGKLTRPDKCGCKTCCEPTPDTQSAGDNTVTMFSGEASEHETDLQIPGRGIDYAFSRSYRSRVTPLPKESDDFGANWRFSYSDQLIRFGNDIIRIGGDNREDVFPDGAVKQATTQEFYQVLRTLPNGDLQIRSQDGRVETYHRLTHATLPGRLKEIRDADDNFLTILYAPITFTKDGKTVTKQVLATVVDTMGRNIQYRYFGNAATIRTVPTVANGAKGRLAEVEDFFGRKIRFQYDSQGNLTEATGASVAGTSHGNDFPDGKTTRYGYRTLTPAELAIDPVQMARLAHNLLSETSPNEVANGGPPRVVYTYGEDPNDPETFDRVIAQAWGGGQSNDSGVPAGGTITYQYENLVFAPPFGGPVPSLTNTPGVRVTANDRNGNVTEFVYSDWDTLLSAKEFTNRDIRPGDPSFYETKYEYNDDKELLKTTNPLGNVDERDFDETNPDRFRQGNMLSSSALPDSRGGDQAFITNTQTYEPIYNQVRTMTEARGNDPGYLPQNGGANSPARYTTVYTFDYQEGTNFAGLANELGITVAQVQARLAGAGIPMGLGDVNGDGRTNQISGNVIRIQYPTVNLLPGSHQAIVEGDTQQEIVELYAYNDFGQMTRMVDPERNVDTYEYFPERDPDGDGTVNSPTRNAATGGYLKQTTRDTTAHPARNSGSNPPITEIRMQYRYDPVGNVIREVDGRGIVTRYEVNRLNQVVQVARAAEAPASGAGSTDEPLPLVAFEFLERTFYDFNDNVVLRQVEDRGNTSGVDGNPPAADLPNVPGADDPDPVDPLDPAFVDTIYKYDLLDNQVEMLEEVAGGAAPEFLRTRYRYDPNENQVLTILPEGNATSAIYDDRDLLFRSKRGALAPPELDAGAPAGSAPTLLAPTDPTDYDVRGGISCDCTSYRYDPNRNVIESVDSDDTDLSPDNNSDIGPGDRTRYIYDGFDRLTSIVDAVGNQTVYQYDPASNVVRTSRFGPVGGPSPTSDGPDDLSFPVSSLGVIQSANLVNDNLLEATESLYDELSRTFQTDRVLFVNTIPTMRSPNVADGATDISKGDLTPGDNDAIPGIGGVTIEGRVSGRTEYDRNSRTTFTVEDDEDTYRIFYDGADRVIKTIDPEGNFVETAYDDNHNVIETRETDVAQVSGVASEIFLTTFFYDSLNRVQQTTDNLGQTLVYRYDSRDNLVAMADAQGPVTGATIARRTFADGPLTVNAINDFGNVTRYFYDGINRQTRQEVVLTELPSVASRPATASGDGIHVGASIFGVKDDPTAPESFTPTPDPGQAGGDGIIRTGSTYDQNSLLSSLVDDQGNITTYLYDNLNRRVTETKGLVRTSPFTETFILGDRRVVSPRAATVSDPAFIPEAQIQEQLDAAKLRIDAIAGMFPPLADDVVDPTPPPQATTIVYGYDPDDNVLIMEDENDTEVFTDYDAINRPIHVRVFRTGQADSHVGDPDFAPAPVTDPDGPHRGPFPAAIGTTSQDYQYDGLSRLVMATDNNNPAGTSDDSLITYAYDSLSRVIEETQKIGVLDAKAISSAWRAENLRSSVTYPNDRELEYTYDGLDRLNNVADAGAALPIADYNYIGTYRVLVRAYPQNGTRMTYLDDSGTVDVGYDGRRRPVQLRHLRSDDSLIVGFTHTYDRMNNKLDEDKLHDAANSEIYSYDSAYRLIDFDRPNPGAIAPLHSDWTLDGVGNWDEIDGQDRTHSAFNELLSEDGTTFAYDDNGNQTVDGTSDLRYEWDFRNRLRKVRDADGELVAAYSYDAANRRIRKDVAGDLDILFGDANLDDVFDNSDIDTVVDWILGVEPTPAPGAPAFERADVDDNGIINLADINLMVDKLLGRIDLFPVEREGTDFYYDGWQVLEERNGDHALVQQYVYGVYIDEPLVMDRNLDGNNSAVDATDQPLFYHPNSLHSAFALTDDVATIVEGYLYDPYGRQSVYAPGGNMIVDFGGDDVIGPVGISALSNPYMFTGRRFDAESSLFYYRNRYYSSSLGRFIGRDPIAYEAGSMGLYVYVRSQPLVWVDPTGLKAASFRLEFDHDNCTLTFLQEWQLSWKGPWTAPQKTAWKSSVNTVINASFGTKIKNNPKMSIAAHACPCCEYQLILKISFDEGWSIDEDIEVDVYHESRRSGVATDRESATLDRFDVNSQIKQHSNGVTTYRQTPLVHEFGHILGLDHPGHGLPGVAPNSSAEYEADAPALLGLGMQMRRTYWNPILNKLASWKGKACDFSVG